MTATPRLLGGRYEMGDVLGRGGMAEVHIGRDTRLGRTVAIKLLRSDLARDPAFQARFRREAQSAASLNHPAVVAVYDSGEDRGDGDGVPAPYIVMEYVEGRTLRELVSEANPMPWREALQLMSPMLAALGYSHRAGIVHRDIKPANVMLTPGGDVKVMDFGIARALADSAATMTATQAVIGTAQYLSPEQARGETVDARSDLYSAGCLLFELLTGRPPFVADSPVAIAYQHVGEQPTAPSALVPALPEVVDAIVLHALEKERGSRYQSADEFRDDVDAALAGHRISSAALGTAAAGAGAAAFGEATVAMDAVPGTATSYLPAAAEESVLPTRAGAQQVRSRRTGWWIALGVLAAVLVAGAAVFGPGLLGADTPKAAAKVTVPDLSDKTLEEATNLLVSKNLSMGDKKEEANDLEAGQIIRQSPASGTSADVGSPVSVVVSTGPNSVSVPDLTGMTEKQAMKALETEGLKLGDTSIVDSVSQSPNRVVSSDPASGQSVKKGETVDIELASGKVKVPNVVGLQLAEARKILTDLGLAVRSTEYVPSSQEENSVIAQSVTDKRVPEGTEVVLKIAAKQPTASPTSTTTPTPTEPTEPPTDSPTTPPASDPTPTTESTQS